MSKQTSSPNKLKERIAALEQVDVAPSPQLPSPTPSSAQLSAGPNNANTNVSALKARIAKFEGMGSVPVPSKGQFGLGVPSDARTGSKSRELYGNRIPTPIRAIPTGLGVSPNTSSFIPSPNTSLSGRKVSVTSASDYGTFDDMDSEFGEMLPYQHTGRSLSPQVTGSEFSKALAFATALESGNARALTPQITGTELLQRVPRATKFTTALEIAKKADNQVQARKVSQQTQHQPEVSDSPQQNAEAFTTNGAEYGNFDIIAPSIQISPEIPSPSSNSAFEVPNNSELPDFDTSPSDLIPVMDAEPLSLPLSLARPEDAVTRNEALGQDLYSPITPVALSASIPSTEDTAEQALHFAQDESPSPPSRVPQPTSMVSEEAAVSVNGADASHSEVSSLSFEAGGSEADQQSMRHATSTEDLILERRESDRHPSSTEKDTHNGSDSQAGAVLAVEFPKDFVREELPHSPLSSSRSESDVSVLPEPVLDALVLDSPPTPPSKSPEPILLPETPPRTRRSLPDVPPTPPAPATPRSARNLPALPSNPPRSPPRDLPAPPNAPATSEDEILNPDSQSLFQPFSPASTESYSDNSTTSGFSSPMTAVSPSGEYIVMTPPSTEQTFLSFRAPPGQVVKEGEDSDAEGTVHEHHQHMRPATGADTSSTLGSDLNPPPSSDSARRRTPSTPRRSRPMTMMESPTRPYFNAPTSFTSASSALSPEETEFGNVTLHKASHSFSNGRPRHNEPNLSINQPQTRSFNAVVHARVTERPAMPPKDALYQPTTPRKNRVQRSANLDVPGSPAPPPDLAALLQSAAILEQQLADGVLPSEAPPQAFLDPVSPVSEEDTFPGEFGSPIPLQPRLRDVKGRKRTFKITRGKSKSEDIDDLTLLAPSAQLRPTAGAPPPRPSTVYEMPSSPPHNHGQPSTSTSDFLPPMPPQKSPTSTAKYLTGLRRFATVSNHGARHSVSTSSEISSEDSMLVVTPPDHRSHFTTDGHLQAQGSIRSGMSWPTLAKKKSIVGMEKATAFAEKVWHRTRAKSNASVGNFRDATTSSSSVPDGPGRASSTYARPGVLIPESLRPAPPPGRSKSLYAVPSEDPIFAIHPPSPPPPLPVSLPKPEPIITETRVLIPGEDERTRPTSWVSVASTTSSYTGPSPLKDMFDHFPAVPQQAPPVPPVPAMYQTLDFQDPVTPRYSTRELQ